MNEAARAKDSWWQRRVLRVIGAQLRQGVSPERIALAIAVGGVLAVFPILGTTTALCVLAGFALRLNQPVLLLVNALAAPLQLVLLIPCYRAAEWIGAPHLSLSIPALWRRFREEGLIGFFREFGSIALGGIGVWALAAPVLIACIYFSLRPALQAFAARLGRAGAPR